MHELRRDEQSEAARAHAANTHDSTVDRLQQGTADLAAFRRNTILVPTASSVR